MAAISRFGSRVTHSHRTTEPKEDLQDLVQELIARELNERQESLVPTTSLPHPTEPEQLTARVKEIITTELNVALDKLINAKKIVTASPNVVDFSDKRLIRVKPAQNANDVMTLANLPWAKSDRTHSLHFGSYRLMTTAEPASPQDFITMAYANKHYQPK